MKIATARVKTPEASEVHESFKILRATLTAFLKGKAELADRVVCALLSGGHVLIEDVPGVGKTTLIKAISRLLGLEMKRIQCTSDLLPSDVIGVEIYDPKDHRFVFHQGPIFANLILADELNRASPRTQSALLQAMGEGFVTVDRKTYELPQPFIVFATQNPGDSIGTYPLPESQLDRFAMRLHLNYPSPVKETEIFQASVSDPLSQLPSDLVGAKALGELQREVDTIHISDRIAAYVKRFVDKSRNHPAVRQGISTRGGVSWLRMARAHAFLEGRTFVVPEDLIPLASSCLAHRITCKAGVEAESVIEELVDSVSID